MLDANDLLTILTEAQLSCIKELIDDVIVAADTIIDEVFVAASACDKQGRSFVSVDRLRELNIDMRAVIKRTQRLPGRIVAADCVIKMQIVE